MRSTNKLSRDPQAGANATGGSHAQSSDRFTFRLAILALQDLDGYVDALLGLARDQIVARRPAISRRLSQGVFHETEWQWP